METKDIRPLAKDAPPVGVALPAKTQRPLRTRHVPQRTCVGCRLTSAKREFVRLICTPSGHVEIDPTGKRAGRGAYLCLNATCWELALKKKRLDTALKTHLAQEDMERLRVYATKLPT